MSKPAYRFLSFGDMTYMAAWLFDYNTDEADMTYMAAWLSDYNTDEADCHIQTTLRTNA